MQEQAIAVALGRRQIDCTVLNADQLRELAKNCIAQHRQFALPFQHA